MFKKRTRPTSVREKAVEEKKDDVTGESEKVEGNEEEEEVA